MLPCIFLDQRIVGFYFCTDRGIGITFTAAAKQRDCTTKQYHDQNDHYCNPAACNNRRYQCFCPCNNRSDSCYGSFHGCFSRSSRRLCGDSCCLCCFLCGFCRSLCRCLCGFGSLLRGLNGSFGSRLCCFYASFGCFYRAFCRCLDGFSCTSGRLLNRSFGIC